MSWKEAHPALVAAEGGGSDLLVAQCTETIR